MLDRSTSTLAKATQNGQERLLNIGEMAKSVGVTPKTVRHYHKIGLIPEPERSESGYRLYRPRDLLHLQHIRYLRSLGFSLSRIKGLWGQTDGKLLEQELRSVRQELMAQIEVLETRVEKIKTFLQEDTFKELHRSLDIPNVEVMRDIFKHFI